MFHKLANSFVVDYCLRTGKWSGGYALAMLGKELRRARLAAGLTQEQLSLEAGVDRTYISQLEHDKKSPTLEVLFRLCDAMGASAAALVRRAEKARAAGK